MSDERAKPTKRQGYFAIAAGVLFFITALGGKQPIFFALGAFWLAIGAYYLKKAR